MSKGWVSHEYTSNTRVHEYRMTKKEYQTSTGRVPDGYGSNYTGYRVNREAINNNSSNKQDCLNCH